MKTYIKILTALLTLTLQTTTANAEGDSEVDEIIKKQCQYIVYGQGQGDELANTFLVSIVLEKQFMVRVEEESDFAKKASIAEINHKACESALTNTEKSSFVSIINYEVEKVLRKPKPHTATSTNQHNTVISHVILYTWPHLI